MTTTPNNKENDTMIIAFILAIIIIVCLTSCSTRKVNKSEIKETETKTELIAENTKTEVSENTKIVDTSTTDEIEYIPIDNSKPIIVNGKSYFNTKIKHSKKKNNISIVKDKKVSQIKEKSANLTYKKDRVIEMKVSERKSFNFWWLLLLLIPAIYYLYRKFA
jgi:hypothetical protein